MQTRASDTHSAFEGLENLIGAHFTGVSDGLDVSLEKSERNMLLRAARDRKSLTGYERDQVRELKRIATRPSQVTVLAEEGWQTVPDRETDLPDRELYSTRYLDHGDGKIYRALSDSNNHVYIIVRCEDAESHRTK